ncbi:glycosyltransferase family 2 protein [Nitratiruptor sp. SB155-2]|uniref:glycosyltransferase family 2 protein n=1 Tax=Nitratiruptor sp. (strain SB155-2) TaxID=387092 RepID=UPI0001587202|nr:glycosyltransferase [Nitratiruptor sp. SB155-2]BAF69788.1 glycosyl transferase [Nitratiruptor sp. SB155-2]
MQLQNISPLFSVIIPVYNRANFIARAIESVLHQTFRDFELIVVDDGSTDETPKVLERYPIQVIRQENKGVSAARNRGIKAAKGKIIALLDSDDEWKKNHLRTHADFFQSHPEYTIHQTDEIWIRNGKFLNKKKIHQKKSGYIFYDSLRLCLISPSAVAIKKELFNEVGLFREDFEVCEDYELWLRITKKYPVGFTPIQTVIKYGGHEDQLSQKYFGMDRWRIKAMLPFCEDPKVREIALQKCTILINGAKKHGNQQILQEFEPILEQLKEKF